MIYTINDCNLVELNKIQSVNGNLTVIENGKFFPFDINRIYYLYDIPGGESRGGHAHKELEQIIIAASGSFNLRLDDGFNVKSFELNRPNFAVNIKPGIWRDIDNFSNGAICLVLASLEYTESDYIRSYKEFKEYKKV